ncbi:hypothetical protein SLS60_003021 [Paraconiothyrium brasiliense]|uniref:Uncharacterized protein n=1 Tax=Paraconiothyrium brasiliense TaxID=300254 RepID=A0ABR3RVT3_9PLEO
MSALKRTATDHDPAERPVKRPRPQAQFQRRPVSALRPAQPSSIREAIYISSASPATGRDPRTAEQKTPSGGIKPLDSFQDCVVNSIESAPGGRNYRTGFEHYLYLTKRYAAQYKNVSVEFNTYRHAAPLNAPPGDPLPDTAPQSLDPGLPDPRFDYKTLPDHIKEYTQPIYKARTYNPLISLAIIRLAEKNLPFMDFSSNLTHLPNVGPQTLPPEFPPVEEEEMPFLDMATTWAVLPGDQDITILFLPNYHVDGRHAIGYYTRKVPSKRFCSMLFTPCTTSELRLAGLLDFVPIDSDLGVSDIPNAEIGEDGGAVPWDVTEVGVKDGKWLYPIEEDIVAWEDAEDVAGWEWVVWVRVTLRKTAEDSEDGTNRDGGKWAEVRWE